jgi:hypothetical protein
MSSFPRCRSIAWLGAIGLCGSLGCAKVNSTAGGGSGGSAGTHAGLGGSGGRRDNTGSGGTGVRVDGSVVDVPPPITDFPPGPILGTPTTPTSAPTLFGGTPRNNSAPCVVSPQDGTLMPQNWLRPRFEWKANTDQNLTEIVLTVARFPTPLKIYTDGPNYSLDSALWDDLRRSVNDEPITVAIRTMTLSSTGTVQQPPSATSTVTFTIAPVEAPGKIVYWSLAGDGSQGTGMLKGFGVGEEGVRDVLTPDQVTNRNTTNDGCIGCHTSVPGGDSVQFVFGPPTKLINLDTYTNNIADIQMGTAGTLPTYVTPGALALLQTLRGIPAFSTSHWKDGDRIVLLTDAHEQGNLYWVQLDTPAPVMQGTLARTNDPGGATEPTFSHDGSRVVYVSSSTTDGSIHDGRLDSGPADLYMIPYNDRAGGVATKLGGAADPNFSEYYPAFSPNDDLVAFTRVAGPSMPTPRFTYGNFNSEIYVVQTTGGAAIRLAANDPPACLFKTSPGLLNDWSKWSPEATTAANGKTYNWLTFSSVRNGTPQLYVTAIVTQPGMAPKTYPALYLWNQPPTESNHTPSWDNFKIPPVVIVP